MGMAIGLQQGSGLALPIDTLARRVDRILVSGHISRATLGLDVAPDGLVKQLGVGRGGGTVVIRVHSVSPASKAGIYEGDVIVGINNHRITSLDDLLAALELCEPGETVTVSLRRPVDGTSKVQMANPRTTVSFEQQPNSRYANMRVQVQLGHV